MTHVYKKGDVLDAQQLNDDNDEQNKAIAGKSVVTSVPSQLSMLLSRKDVLADTTDEISINGMLIYEAVGETTGKTGMTMLLIGNELSLFKTDLDSAGEPVPLMLSGLKYLNQEVHSTGGLGIVSIGFIGKLNVQAEQKFVLNEPIKLMRAEISNTNTNMGKNAYVNLFNPSDGTYGKLKIDPVSESGINFYTLTLMTTTQDGGNSFTADKSTITDLQRGN
jgi:hypothetical protein